MLVRKWLGKHEKKVLAILLAYQQSHQNKRMALSQLKKDSGVWTSYRFWRMVNGLEAKGMIKVFADLRRFVKDWIPDPSAGYQELFRVHYVQLTDLGENVAKFLDAEFP